MKTMRTGSLRQPSLSPGILRRQVCAELLDLFDVSSFDSVFFPGRQWGRYDELMTEYRQAVYRLRRDGLIARRDRHGGAPKLALTAEGRGHVSAELVPEKLWNRRWDGRWYVLMYDVPEKERSYREALNRFLKRNRMGSLQKSVFVSVRDIRPLFYDLDVAAAVAEYANIFESRTVAGQSNSVLVKRAWDFDRLRKIQGDYLEACAARMRRPVREIPFSSVFAAMRSELRYYLEAMRRDPLLPKSLWPRDYLGHGVASSFRRRIWQLAGRLIGHV